MTIHAEKYIGFMLLLFVWCGGICGLQAQDGGSRITEEEEYALKSAFVYQICKFSQWPESENTEKPFVIAVLGDLRSGKGITIPEDKLIADRKVVVQKIDTIEELSNAEAVFIGASEVSRLDSIMAYVQNKAILTFADTENFTEKGVIFNFYVEDNYVKIIINQTFAEKSLVMLHSRLFTIGTVVQ